MRRNSTLIAGLMLALAAALGWVLIGPAETGSGTAQVHADAPSGERSMDLSAPSALDEPATPLSESAGRMAVESTDETGSLAPIEWIDPAQTAITGRTVDTKGAAIAGAALELWASSSRIVDPRWPTRASFSAHLETQSGADGRFTIEDLPGFGTYLYLTAEAPGMAPTDLFAFEAQPGRVRDLGDIRLAPPMQLFGTVFNEHAQPLAGAELWLSKGTVGSNRVRTVAQPAGSADGAGRFTIDGLGAGSYVVGARAPGYAVNFSDTIRLDPGSLPPGEVSLHLTEGYTLLGRVIDHASKLGLAGAHLRLMPTSANNAQYFELETDGAGGFEFPGLDIGKRLNAEVRLEGYLPTTWPLRPSGTTAAQLEQRIRMYPARSLTVTVLAGATGEPVAGAQLFTSGSNPRSLRTAAMAGFAVAPGTAPIGVTDALGVAVVPMARDEPWLTILAEDFAPQTISSAPRARLMSTYTEDEALEVRLVLGTVLAIHVRSGGKAVAQAEVELRIATSHPGQLTASQSTHTNALLRGARLPMRRVGPDILWRDESTLSPTARGRTDGRGELLLDELPKGLYFVHVAARADLEAATFGPIAIFETSGRVDFDVELQPAAALFGHVTARGAPAAGQRVIAIRSLEDKPQPEGRQLPQVADQVSTKSAADGSFRLAGLAAGTWKVVALRPLSLSELSSPVHGVAALSYQLQQRSQLIELGPGEERAVDLEAQSLGARLSGRVLINHELMAGVEVCGNFRDNTGNRQSFRVHTDSTGRYETGGLLPGHWSITAGLEPTSDSNRRIFRSSTTVARLSLTVPDDLDVTFNIEVEIGNVRLMIELIDPDTLDDEQPKALAKVPWLQVNVAADPSRGGIAGQPDGVVTGQFLTAPGEFTLSNLPVGAYNITVSGSGVTSQTAKLRVTANNATPLKMELERLFEEDATPFELDQRYL